MKRPMTAILCAALAACGGASSGPSSAEGVGASSPTIASSPTAAASSATPASAPPEKWTELEVSPGASELQPGADAIAGKDWAKARALLEPVIAKLEHEDRGADVTLAGRALLGRACAALKDTACSDKAYGAVLDAWKDPDAARYTSAAGKEHAQRALLAVGEALFVQAEKKRAAVEAISFPMYSGKGDKAAIQQFLNEKVAPWVTKKHTAIREAEDEYAKVAQLEPPPPHWLVDASSRIGQMKGRFVAEFRAAPIPKEWSQHGPVEGVDGANWDDIRESYYAALDEASAPLKQEAKAAFETCRETSANSGYVDEFSKSCEAWLTANK